MNRPDALRPGTVGKPIDRVEVKIAPDGEILTRGPHVMKGYYNKPEATKEAIDGDGWFHTGDIGLLDRDGYLSITDRKKDIIVTSGGKNIAPQPIENALKSSPPHRRDRDDRQQAQLPRRAGGPELREPREVGAGAGHGLREPGGAVRRSPGGRALRPHGEGPHQGYAQFEKIKKMAVLPREFSLETGELTPKLSVKRRVVEQKYKDVIDRLYEGAGPADAEA